MAHRIEPHPQAHEQLRTEAPSQKEHTDKYVSAFVSSDSMVDMSFRNPVLSKSADHFKVGIDELTVNLGNLSMLEYGVGDVLFRVIRRGLDNEGPLADFEMIDGPAGNLTKWRDAFQFAVDRAYLTIHEILGRCTEIAVAVGTFIRDWGFVNQGPGQWIQPLAANFGNFEHFRISVTPNGQLKFSGNRLFWANFCIEVPIVKYREILFKDPDKRYLSMHPQSGAVIDPSSASAASAHAPYTIDIAGTLTVPPFNPAYAPDQYGDLDNVGSVEYIAAGNLLNTLDRRVTLEVGSSLPIKNSPLVDHGVEAPDFVLGRYMFHQPYAMKNWAAGIPENNPIPEITVPQLGTISVQGPRDRVVFHHLQPQQKIQNLRLRLWARVRTYDEVSRTWGMKAIICPVQGSDYWHIRLHFVPK